MAKRQKPEKQHDNQFSDAISDHRQTVENMADTAQASVLSHWLD